MYTQAGNLLGAISLHDFAASTSGYENITTHFLSAVPQLHPGFYEDPNQYVIPRSYTIRTDFRIYDLVYVTLIRLLKLISCVSLQPFNSNPMYVPFHSMFAQFDRSRILEPKWQELGPYSNIRIPCLQRTVFFRRCNLKLGRSQAFSGDP